MSCPAPFLDLSQYSGGGFVDGRLCETIGNITCCLPCPMTDWTYSDAFDTVGVVAEWVAVVSLICCLFLLLSWAVLPIDKTHRHYLSICVTIAVSFINLGFIIPLAGRPDQCFDAITPNDMQTSSICGASGSFIVLGGWAGVLWVFLRSLSLHLQICWQVVVGRSFMWFAQATGWGIPALGIVLALTLSGVSFRFGNTCHINHHNSLADLWIPLLVFAGLTIIIQFATFGYCIKVYLASLADNNATTENSAGLPSYTNSIRTMTPRQAYRRVRRVIQLQWRGIAIVLIIICDVVFFAIVFVFQDNTLMEIQNDPTIADAWITCLVLSSGDKNQCLDKASSFVVNVATIGAVLILLAMNGIWLLILLGRLSMFTGWIELLTRQPLQGKREFVSVDALGGPYDLKINDPRSYEMLGRDKDGMVTPDAVREGPIYPPLRSYLASSTHTPTASTPPAGPGSASAGAMDADSQHHQHQYHNSNTMYSPALSQTGSGSGAGGVPSGRRTPDYFGQAARYVPPQRSFSSPRPPTREGQASVTSWHDNASQSRPYSPPISHHYSQGSYGGGGQQQQQQQQQHENMNPLGMNRI